MDLSHLDDDAPPAADDSIITQITETAAKHQRTRRITTGAVAAVCSAALVFGAARVLGNDGNSQRVAIVGGPATNMRDSVPTTRLPATTSSTVSDPNIWVTVDLQLDALQVQQGKNLTGTVIFNNRTGRRVTFANKNGCVNKWHAGVTSEDSRPTAWVESLECAKTPTSPTMYTDFPPGITQVPFSTKTYEQICTESCPKALPLGRAFVWFLGPSEHMALPPAQQIVISN